MADPAQLQSVRQLLAARLPRARTGFAVRPTPAPVPTGITTLDRLLGGGLPQGETTELVGPGPGSGSAQVIHAILRQAAAEGRFLALVDGSDSFDADAAEAADLARLLWVRCRTVDEAMSATDVLLRDRNFPLILVDLKLNPPAQLRRLSGSVWHRFHRLREQHRTTLLVVTSQPLVGGAARRVQLERRLSITHTAQSPRELWPALEFTLLRAVTLGEPEPVPLPASTQLDTYSEPERFALVG
jgi:hypothetical protein